jgi:hypothetical protein
VTTLSFEAVNSPAILNIYNVNGQLIQAYYLSSQQQSVVWDASDIPAGVYYARLMMGEEIAVQKLVVR